MDCHFGSGIDSAATVTAWEPPGSFVADSEDFAPGGPSVTTEWTVESSGEGICVVRVEHSLFATSDEWDGHLMATEAGWPAFFRILQIYMTQFRGQSYALLELMGAAPELGPGWAALADGLGRAGATEGERRIAPANAPPFAGSVDFIPDDSEIILQLEQPTSGVAHLFALHAGDRTLLSVRLYLYGDDGADVVARDQHTWQSWMEERFSLQPG